jgi:hypothetical protein
MLFGARRVPVPHLKEVHVDWGRRTFGWNWKQYRYIGCPNAYLDSGYRCNRTFCVRSVLRGKAQLGSSDVVPNMNLVVGIVGAGLVGKTLLSQICQEVSFSCYFPQRLG